MKTYQEYHEEYLLSTESRDLAFDEWLMLLLDRQEEKFLKNACERFKEFMRVQYGEDIDESMEMYFRKAIGD